MTGNGGVLSVTGGSFIGNQASNGGGLAVGGRAALFLSALTDLRANVALLGGGGVWLQTTGTFGSVDTQWSGNVPDDFKGQNYSAAAPTVIFCANGQPCLTY